MKKKTVLLVDDEPDLVEMLKMRLAHNNYSCLVASSAIEALDLLKEARPNIILLDIKLPDASGLQVLKSIKEDSNTSDLPVLLLTALSDEETVTKGIEGGAVGFLNKSCSSEELLYMLAEHAI